MLTIIAQTLFLWFAVAPLLPHAAATNVARDWMEAGFSREVLPHANPSMPSPKNSWHALSRLLGIQKGLALLECHPHQAPALVSPPLLSRVIHVSLTFCAWTEAQCFVCSMERVPDRGELR